MAQRTISLIRHGQYNKSVKDALGGTLTELGRQQADVTGRALQHLKVDRIHYSTMRRAHETATLIAQHLPNVPLVGTDQLWECLPTIPPHLDDVFEIMRQRNPELTPQHVAENKLRLDRVFESFFIPTDETNQHDLIICHGNVIRYLMCRVLDMNPHKWINMAIFHCGICQIEIEPDDYAEQVGDPTDILTMISFNETHHLPINMRTDQ